MSAGRADLPRGDASRPYAPPEAGISPSSSYMALCAAQNISGERRSTTFFPPAASSPRRSRFRMSSRMASASSAGVLGLAHLALPVVNLRDQITKLRDSSLI